jgi:hypothetical protein
MADTVVRFTSVMAHISCFAYGNSQFDDSFMFPCLQSELRVGQSTNGSLRTELSSRSHNDVVTSVHFLCFDHLILAQSQPLAVSDVAFV